jgi:hypothetical protein
MLLFLIFVFEKSLVIYWYTKLFVFLKTLVCLITASKTILFLLKDFHGIECYQLGYQLALCWTGLLLICLIVFNTFTLIHQSLNHLWWHPVFFKEAIQVLWFFFSLINKVGQILFDVWFLIYFDDLKIFKVIRNLADSHKLQSVLDAFHQFFKIS